MSEDSAADHAPVTAVELGRLLAHDCRTPLHAIRGFTELVLGGAAGPLSAEALGYLSQIARAGRALEEALAHAQEVVDLDVRRPLPCLLQMDLGALLQALCFARMGDGADRPLPLIRGDPTTWLRIGEACRSYLQGDDGDGTSMTARTHHADRGGLEVVLRRADVSQRGYAGVLGIDVARRRAARQGGCLRLLDQDSIGLAWPEHLVLGPR